MTLLAAAVHSGPAAAFTTGQMCVKAELGNPPGTICTANDIMQFNLAVLNGVTSCVAGSNVVVQLRATVDSNAGKDDLGFFLPEGNFSAKDGASCSRDILTPLVTQVACNMDSDCSTGAICESGFCYDPLMANGGPYPNLDGDACGDAPDSMIGPYVYTLNGGANITLVCQDNDSNMKADVIACLAWNNMMDAQCHGDADADPSTKAKCQCLTVQLGDINVVTSTTTPPTTTTAPPTTTTAPPTTTTAPPTTTTAPPTTTTAPVTTTTFPATTTTSTTMPPRAVPAVGRPGSAALTLSLMLGLALVLALSRRPL